MSWITVVRGVVGAVFILRLAGESRNAATESISKHETVSQDLSESVYQVGYSAYPLGTAHRGFGSEMHMALDGQGRLQIGLGEGGRRAAPAVEEARATHIAALRDFIVLLVVDLCVYLQFYNSQSAELRLWVLKWAQTRYIQPKIRTHVRRVGMSLHPPCTPVEHSPMSPLASGCLPCLGVGRLPSFEYDTKLVAR